MKTKDANAKVKVTIPSLLSFKDLTAKLIKKCIIRPINTNLAIKYCIIQIGILKEGVGYEI
ncbi:hypothetical protein C1N70_19345 [Cytobacillus firmus]